MVVRRFVSYIIRRFRTSMLRARGMKIGKGTLIDAGSFWGMPKRVVIGPGCYVNRRCYFDVTGKITLGSNVVIGHGVTFITARHEIGTRVQRSGPVQAVSIIVEDGAWIGANSTILPGVTIGRGSIVGAGAVVTVTVQPDTVVVGVPAKVIRRMEPLLDAHPRSDLSVLPQEDLKSEPDVLSA